MNEKIQVFQTQFYGKKPKQQVTYDHLLKDKKINFNTFKTLYGHPEKGVRVVKMGNEMLRVDNSNFTFNAI